MLVSLRAWCAILLLSLPVLSHAADAPAAGTPAAGTPAAGAPIPVRDFFRHSAIGAATLSPDGRHAAMTVAADNGVLMLVLLPLDTLQPRVLVKARSDVHRLRWVNDKRIAFTFTDRTVPPGGQYAGPGLYAINIDGSGLRELATRETSLATEGRIVRPLSFNTTLLDSPGTQDGDAIYVLQYSADLGKDVLADLVRLDTVTGRWQIQQRPGRTVQWLLDEKGEPRIAVTNDGPELTTHYLEPATGKWRKLFAAGRQDALSMTPYAMGPDGVLYVVSRKGGDKQALYRYDIAAGKLLPEPVVAVDGYDFTGTVIFREARMAGVHYQTDAPGTFWLDARAAQIQKDVDALLPETVNLLAFARRGDTRQVLVHAVSDTDPGAVLLFDSAAKQLRVLGRTSPAIDPRRMAEKNMVRYTARDGLSIPAYLTLPRAAKKNLPLVVLVHGGPWVRGGSWLFDPAVQFLASRGYAVLEPEFRGSTGFGMRHMTAGFKQWGLTMQDDLADGARWAIAQGIADPQRICIAGASYGGYATLMGLIKDPDLFRCGIDWAGVTDIDLLYDVHWSDVGDSVKIYGLPRMVGDQKQDAAQFKATSPIANAARIRRPLLLAYGGADRRVPLVHGTRLRDAVKAGNQEVEWVEYPEEGHGWQLDETNVDFWSRVERFLERHIGPRVQAR